MTTVTTTAAIITMYAARSIQPPAVSPNSPTAGSIIIAMKTTWSTVLSLPPLEAAITQRRTMMNRRIVIAASRTMMLIVAHQGRSPRIESMMIAAPTTQP